MADEADRSAVLTVLQVAFLEKCDDQGLGPQSWPLSWLPDLVVECLRKKDGVVVLCVCLGTVQY